MDLATFGLGVGLAAVIYICIMLVGKVADGSFMDWTEYFKKKFRLSEAVAGETIQALGTSAPEIAVSMIGLYLFSENPALGLGTIIGSAIFQISPVIGVPLLLSPKPMKVDWFPVVRASIIYAISVLLLMLFIWTDKQIEWWECSILALYHISYATWIIFTSKAAPHYEGFDEEADKSLFGRVAHVIAPGPRRKISFLGGFPIGFFLVLGAIGLLCIGLVQATEKLGAEIIGLSIAFLSLTVLAGGTSAPELASNVSLAKEGKGNQLIGNAVGSNTLDICISFALVSIPYTIFTGPIKVAGTEFDQMFQSTIILLVLLLLFVGMMWVSRWVAHRWQGWVLISAYVAFVIYSLYIDGALG